ncbi:DUF2125 domain containing protein [Sulfitobacter noctilucicola]|uniref:DUF2125 domain-containing protein n=1 Tax=Sulfitobacter noctilucicola TaxID=1342301 RepID=A0A7W6M6G4_9RHOB|nr:DUF2125 domain-containing protein [Sulfitobacter noctilucicola]KIN63117.1 DUF2125 domain containing protein [Sulfitobacter noctilucicola]MBB4172356.1 hypothetical protein [Sulfitobacter noctilucicola]
MSPFLSRAFSLALPVSLLSHTALADVTPAEVWADWRAYMEGMGYEVSATENTSGSDLTVEGLNMKFATPDSGGELAMTLGRITFTQNGDGTVSIVLPDTMPITIKGTEGTPDQKPITMALNYSQADHALTASGSPEKMTYLYTAQTVGLDLTQMQVGTDTLDATEARLNFAGNGVSSTTTMTIGDLRGYDQSASVDSLSIDFAFADPDTPESQGAGKGTMNGISLNGTGTLPAMVAKGADINAMLEAGFNVAGNVSYENGSSNFDIKDPQNGAYVMTTSSQGGTLGVKMAPEGIVYDVSQKDVNVGVTAAAMPFPIELAMAESGFNLTMPVRKSDDPQDFAFGITLGDFTMSDIIWSMFDPTAQLPRDPATIVVDLSGKMKLLVDILDPEMATGRISGPGELQALNVGTLLVSAAGAKLEGSGDVTFDTAGPALVPGLGTPVGDVNLALAGANGLIDKLVAMGFLPQEQAMGARMMMGLFAVPGDTPDTLKSKIEFTQDGQILANGQRLR